MIALFVLLVVTNIAVQAAPTVQLPYVQVTGIVSGHIDRFLGIPYAEPGGWRFQEAPPINESRFASGATLQATNYGNACPQLIGFVFGVTVGEECFFLNVGRPTGVVAGANLPVMVWIYGGGFLGGYSNPYDPTNSLAYATTLGLPYIHVSINYRVGGWGFLASNEVAAKGATNLGLRDQRSALRWIKKYISYFGGDPNKITIYGESAGSISVGMQMLAFGGEKETDLFRAGIMESGAPTSLVVPDIRYWQPVYNDLVTKCDCQASNDTLACLKAVSFDKISSVIYFNPLFPLPGPPLLRVPFGPTLDFDFFPDSPYRLIRDGRFKKVPAIMGDQLDDGASFVNSLNWTDTAFVRKQVGMTWPNLTSDSLDKILEFYPADNTLGCPFNGQNRSYYGLQGKRAAAIYNDLCFTSQRRQFMDKLSDLGANVWTYRFEYDYNPQDINQDTYLGVQHGYDVFAVYKTTDFFLSRQMVSYWAAFATNLNPNNATGIPVWPQFDTSARAQIRFGQTQTTIKADDYRIDASDFVESVFNQMYTFTPDTYPQTSQLSPTAQTAVNPGTRSSATPSDSHLIKCYFLMIALIVCTLL